MPSHHFQQILISFSLTRHQHHRYRQNNNKTEQQKMLNKYKIKKTIAFMPNSRLQLEAIKVREKNEIIVVWSDLISNCRQIPCSMCHIASIRYFVFILGRKCEILFWNWGKKSPVRLAERAVSVRWIKDVVDSIVA